jgi:hypothetical protein
MDVIHRYIPADALPSWLAKPLYQLLEPTYSYAPPKSGLMALVDFSQPSLWAAVGMVLFNPIYWNIVARNGMYRLRIEYASEGGDVVATSREAAAFWGWRTVLPREQRRGAGYGGGLPSCGAS